MPLWVQINYKNFLLKKIQARGKIDAGSGFSTPTLLVRDSDNSQKVSLLKLNIIGINVTASLSKAL
jgi:hypothetical protein